MNLCLQILSIIFLRYMYVVTASISQTSHMKEDLSQRDLIVVNGNVGQIETNSLLRCANTCTQTDNCVSIFYHSKTNQCVLQTFLGAHLDLKEVISTQIKGWKFYEKVNGFGLSSRGVECLQSGFMYDSAVDACYFIRTADSDFDQMRQLCVNMNSQLIKITSQEKQDWVIGVLETEPIIIVAIQGNRDNENSQYQFDDGTQMTYLNWSIDPNGASSPYIVMHKYSNYEWLPWQKLIPLYTGILIVCEK